jgi:hypothetical protein
LLQTNKETLSCYFNIGNANSEPKSEKVRDSSFFYGTKSKRKGTNPQNCRAPIGAHYPFWMEPELQGANSIFFFDESRALKSQLSFWMEPEPFLAE